MTQIQVGFHAVYGHVTFTVLVGIQCAGVDIYVWVKFLYGYFITTSLKQLADTCGYYTLAKR